MTRRCTAMRKNFGKACRLLYSLPNETIGINEDFRAMLKTDMQDLQHGINALMDDLFDSVCHVDMIDMNDFNDGKDANPEKKFKK
jgi:hypothetical protein